MNILIVENDVLVANFIRKILKDIPGVHLVAIATSFAAGFEKASSDIFDIILIDILLGEEFDGIDLVESIREHNTLITIIMLTACQSTKYLEKAFAAGANEYITKPFRPRELLMRVQRWFSLVQKIEFQKNIAYKNLSYDPFKHEFYYHCRKIKLPRKQKVLLLLFLKNPEQLLSTTYIQERFWGDDIVIQKNHNVRANIHVLRSFIADIKDIRIQTVHGEGYMLEAGTQ